jgi:hypothetical protein
MSKQIYDVVGKSKRGFGAVSVQATVGQTSWRTSLFSDRQSQTYFLLLNKKVRREEGIIDDDEIAVTVVLLSTERETGTPPMRGRK